jgi:hypothetical protein
VPKKSKLDPGAKMKRMRGRQFVARARSLPTRKILSTTHTPITYAGHNTSKHARNPVQNEAHERIEWRHGRTA